MLSGDSKRVQYRKYLERVGVIDSLSYALVKLYEEQNKPDDPIRFVRKMICEACPDDGEFDRMTTELEKANKTIFKLEQELERLKSQIKKTPEEIEELLEEGFLSLKGDEVYNNSLLYRYLNREVLDELIPLYTPQPVEANLLDCIASGFEHHQSKVGIYAADPASYDIFHKLFDPIIRDYHGQLENNAEILQNETDWGLIDEIENIDPARKFIRSTRIRIARNLEGYPLFPKLREKQYMEIEEKVIQAVDNFDGEHMGTYVTMDDLDTETKAEMLNRNISFERSDEFLTTAGCYRFWPTGRGLYFNAAETFLIWVNEEDHLRIISTAKCGDLGDVYNRLVKGIQELEKYLTFARHPKYGFITACPTNLGTTLRASVNIRLPLLTADPDRLREIVESSNLQIRGTGGENTPIVDGEMDVSNRQRLGLTEYELIKGLQDGIIELIKAEEKIEAGPDFTEE